ncbi:MAG: hypothetical protein LBQ35_09665 [Spirochaetaceae bacterium]|jgi:hypothetical protein|nr:hypothetical protein [Spirochaetaceae bacterium]
MKTPPGALLPLILGAVIFPRLFAQGAFPSLEADPQARRFAERARNGLDAWQDITDAALWASGAEERGSREVIAAAVEEFLSLPEPAGDPRSRGEAVLTFLHRRFLKGYSLNQTRLDEILRTGRYNCVSSAVLYAIFAGAAGLEVRGVMTRDHALIIVKAGSEWIDVETTNAYGFDPGNRREFHDQFGEVTGFAYVPARNYRDRVSISVLELVSLILSNRIAELEGRNRYAEAVPLAVNRAALLAGRRDPADSDFFAGGERDLQDRLLNYGAALSNAGREADALEWAALAEAALASPGDGRGGERWEEFSFAALNNLIVRHIRAGRITEARNSLNRYGAQVSAARRRSLEALLTEAALAARSNEAGQDPEALLRDIGLARDASLIDGRRAEELRNFVIIREGQRIAASEGPAAAAAYTAGAITRYGGSAQLENALQVYRQNRLAELHNAFARLYNARNFDAARLQARSALSEFPGNRQLQRDLDMAEEALRRR